MLYDYPVLVPPQVFDDPYPPSKTSPFHSPLPPLPYPAVLQDSPSRREVIRILMEDAEAYGAFLSFPAKLQEVFLDFCSGQRGLNLTCAPFFRYIFDPKLHSEHLERFLSSVVGEPVKVCPSFLTGSLPHEDIPSVLLDIRTELASGSLCHITLQKPPLDRSKQQIFCRSSGLAAHPVSRIYSIFLLEKSMEEPLCCSDYYIHRSSQVFNAGLPFNLLQESIFISLDVFRNSVHNITKELDAWLLFLCSDRLWDIARILCAFPEFAEYYRRLAALRHDPKTLTRMFGNLLMEPAPKIRPGT